MAATISQEKIIIYDCFGYLLEKCVECKKCKDKHMCKKYYLKNKTERESKRKVNYTLEPSPFCKDKVPMKKVMSLSQIPYPSATAGGKTFLLFKGIYFTKYAHILKQKLGIIGNISTDEKVVLRCKYGYFRVRKLLQATEEENSSTRCYLFIFTPRKELEESGSEKV